MSSHIPLFFASLMNQCQPAVICMKHMKSGNCTFDNNIYHHIESYDLQRILIRHNIHTVSFLHRWRLGGGGGGGRIHTLPVSVHPKLHKEVSFLHAHAQWFNISHSLIRSIIPKSMILPSLFPKEYRYVACTLAINSVNI